MTVAGYSGYEWDMTKTYHMGMIFLISLRMMFFGHPMVMPFMWNMRSSMRPSVFFESPIWVLGRCNFSLAMASHEPHSHRPWPDISLICHWHIARKKPKVTIWSNMFGCSPDSGMLVCFIMNQVLLAATIHIWTFGLRTGVSIFLDVRVVLIWFFWGPKVAETNTHQKMIGPWVSMEQFGMPEQIFTFPRGIHPQ